MFPSIQKNISAISAFGAKMGVHAYNIANAATDRFKKYRADIVELSHGSIKTDVSEVSTPGYFYYDPGIQAMRETSNVNLAEELVQTIPTSIGYKANRKMISAQNEMLGTLLDIFE